jgi:hypothetical protein
MESEEKKIREAMAIIGRRKTEAKAAAARANGAATRFAEKPLADLPCNCGATEDSAHRATCPRGRAYRRRMKAAAK